jgi:hypothetical protein
VIAGQKQNLTTAQKMMGSISGSVEMNVYPNPASDHLFVSIEMDPRKLRRHSATCEHDGPANLQHQYFYQQRISARTTA